MSTGDKVLRATDGSTIRNIVETRPMGTGRQRINSGVRVLVAQAALVIAQVAPEEPVVREGLAA
jgi:hypothetical protein